jgi:hypothetical protein
VKNFFFWVAAGGCVLFFGVTDSFPNFLFACYLFFTTLFFASFIPFSHLKKHIYLRRLDLLIATVLFALALALLLYKITIITPGLWGDELGPGLMAQQLSQLGHFTPFLPYNLGHPTPLVYLSWLAITLMGKSVVSLRIVSVLFGAAAVSIFYLALRSIFSRSLSLSGAILLMTAYVFVTVARFGYEMSAAIFFFILAVWVFVIFLKKKKAYTVTALSAVLGAGLYTYLAFRTIAVILGLSLMGVIWQQKKNRTQLFALALGSFLIIAGPLLVYGLRHPEQLNERVHSLSVFEQNLPASEIKKELVGASQRTLTMFWQTGDPNPRQNPGGVVPFDIFTVVLAVLGLGFLLKQKPRVGAVISLLVIGILATEIITLEQIPEFHYYGLGHPNTLRISLLVPVMICLVIWAGQELSNKIKDREYRWLSIGIGVLLISGINLYSYFGQKLSPWIYQTNYVKELNAVQFFNHQPPDSQTFASATLFHSPHVQYLLQPRHTLLALPDNFNCNEASFPTGTSVFLVEDLAVCSAQQLQTLQKNPDFELTATYSPWKTLERLVVQKK